MEIIAAFPGERPSIRSCPFTSSRVLAHEKLSMPTAEVLCLIFSGIIVFEYNGLQLINRMESICERTAYDAAFTYKAVRRLHNHFRWNSFASDDSGRFDGDLGLS